MIQTCLTDEQGHETKNIGTSGMTVTGVRVNSSVNVLIEFDIATAEEASAMVAMLLAQLEELHGEDFVARCIAHYAQDTGKQFHDEGDHSFVMIRGRKKR